MSNVTEGTVQVSDTRYVATHVAGARQRMDGSVLLTDPDGRLVVVVPHAN